MQGSSQNDASNACASIGGSIAFHLDGPFSPNSVGETQTNGPASALNPISWTVSTESTDPYFPNGTYSGSTPFQDVNFSFYNPSLNVIGIVVKGGTDYNLYTTTSNVAGSSGLTGNYISPLVGSGNISNISGFWVCAGSPNLVTPSVVTSVYSGTAPNGTLVDPSTPLNSPASVYDTVTVTGANSTAPTGTVSFVLYKNGVAQPTTLADTVSLSPSGSDAATATSPQFTGLGTASYYFVATYNGDGTYSSLAGANEDFSVALQAPSVVTVAHPVTGSATDTVTVSGPAGDPIPTGSVRFTLYSSNGTSEGTDTQNLSGGTATSTSFSLIALAPGTYHFVAVYTPDLAASVYYTSGNDGGTSTTSSDGESFSVTTPPPPPTPGTPPAATLSTTPSINGLTASDFATVAGNSGTPTGTVTFTLYSGLQGSGTIVSTFAPDKVALVNGSATSVSSGTLPAGNYYFMVTYSGDGTYSAITPGTAEQFSISFLKPVLGTTPTVTGLSATDSATVTGTSGTPTGTVTFTLFSGTPGNGKQVSSYRPDTVTLTGGTASSASTGTLASGNYYFMVTYSGDGTYSAITPGTAEAFTIIAVSPAPAPKKHKKPVVPPYKIPTKPPTTGFGGSARTVYNGGLLVGGSSVLVFGLLMMAYALRRRRRS